MSDLNLSPLNKSFNQSNSSKAKCNFELSMPLDVQIIGSVLYIIIFFVGIVGNVCVIFVLVKEKRLRNFTNYLLANLSVADLMVLVACVPSGIHDLFAKERWYLGKIMCYAIGFVENSMGFASILTITVITLDRYWVICRPLSVKSVMNQSRTFKLIILIWIISIIINLPIISFTYYKEATFFDCTVAYKCTVTIDSRLKHFYIISVYFLNYFLIGIILLLMYARIFVFLRKSNTFLISCSNEHSSNSKKESLTNTDSSRVFSGLPNNEVINLTRKIGTKRSSNTRNRIDSRAGNFILFKRDEGESLIALNINNGKCGKYVKQRRQIIILLVIIIVFFYLSLFPLKIWNLAILYFSHQPSFTEVITLRNYWYINICVRVFFVHEQFDKSTFI